MVISINTELNIKDIVYIIVISLTSILSLITVIIAIKNRKNTLRELVYKEQLKFISNLTLELYYLHSDLTRIQNNIEVDRSNTKNKIENIFKVMFSNTHLVWNNIIGKASDTLSSADCFIKNSGKENFDKYFDNYKKLIKTIRKEMGVDSLSKENKKVIGNFNL